MTDCCCHGYRTKAWSGLFHPHPPPPISETKPGQPSSPLPHPQISPYLFQCVSNCWWSEVWPRWGCCRCLVLEWVDVHCWWWGRVHSSHHSSAVLCVGCCHAIDNPLAAGLSLYCHWIWILVGVAPWLRGQSVTRIMILNPCYECVVGICICMWFWNIDFSLCLANLLGFFFFNLYLFIDWFNFCWYIYFLAPETMMTKTRNNVTWCVKLH